MKEFSEKFDFNDLSNMTWSSIVTSLVQEIQKDESVKGRHEYMTPKYLIEIQPKKDQFDGIFNYLQTHGNIKDEIDITYSSRGGGDPFNLFQYEDKDNYFETLLAARHYRKSSFHLLLKILVNQHLQIANH